MDYSEIINSKIFTRYGAFSATLKRWKNSGDKVVFTNGCFDILHRGHIDNLAKAAGMGDRLVIGLNSDESTKRLKGPGRPVIDENSRAMLLASLFFVDAVVLFGEDTPKELVENILPDILVKGSDYRIEDIAGHELVIDHGGKVETIPLLEGFSSSAIMNRIKNLPA